MTGNYLLAKHLYNLGLNITCITNYLTEYNFYDANILKGPYHKWRNYICEKQNLNDLEAFDWENSVGIGTVAGYNNLHVLDIDGCTNEDFVEDILIILGLPRHYEWVIKSGSLDGYHIYFYSDIMSELDEDQVATSYPANLDNVGLFQKMELLWKTHVVLPNSLHKSGEKYSFINCKFPLKKPEQIEIKKFQVIEGLFLNLSGLERLKVYYSKSLEKHKTLIQPSTNDQFELSNIEKDLIFVYDIETDGLIENDQFPNILQISWMIMDVDGIVYKKETELINGKLNNNSDAFKVHNLKPEIIKKLGQSPENVYKKIITDLKFCSTIVAHNLNFDLTILQNEMNKNNFYFNFGNLFKLCTMEWGTNEITSKTNPNPKYLKLTELYKYLFNHEIIQFHNSSSDVTILAKCVKEMLYKGLLVLK